MAWILWDTQKFWSWPSFAVNCSNIVGGTHRLALLALHLWKYWGTGNSRNYWRHPYWSVTYTIYVSMDLKEIFSLKPLTMKHHIEWQHLFIAISWQIIHCTIFCVNHIKQIEKPLKQASSKEESDQQKTIWDTGAWSLANKAKYPATAVSYTFLLT